MINKPEPTGDRIWGALLHLDYLGKKFDNDLRIFTTIFLIYLFAIGFVFIGFVYFIENNLVISKIEKINFFVLFTTVMAIIALNYLVSNTVNKYIFKIFNNESVFSSLDMIFKFMSGIFFASLLAVAPFFYEEINSAFLSSNDLKHLSLAEIQYLQFIIKSCVYLLILLFFGCNLSYQITFEKYYSKYKEDKLIHQISEDIVKQMQQRNISKES